VDAGEHAGERPGQKPSNRREVPAPQSVCIRDELNTVAHAPKSRSGATRDDEFGTPDAFNHYAVGWAHAMDTPYQWTKQVASHWGGTRNGTTVHWPNGFASRGEMRSQFHHVIDVAATVLDAAGLPEPLFVDGVAQIPYHGKSMAYAFDDAAAAR
jgi:arylsulfatase